MIRLLHDVATYLGLVFVVLLVVEYGGFVSPPPSRYLALYKVYVVTLILALIVWWSHLNHGQLTTRLRRRRRLGLRFVLGVVLALVVSVLSVGRFVAIPLKLLVYVYGTVGAAGVLLAISRGRQATLDEFGTGRRPELARDGPFFIAVGLFAAALFAFHSSGLDDQLLGVVLFFASILYYSHRTLLSDV